MKRIYDRKGFFIDVEKCHYPSRLFSYGWGDSTETYNLYHTGGRTFLDAKKAWKHARSCEQTR